MQKAHKSIQIFKNPLLEKFTHVHPLTPLIVWAPIFAWFMYRSLYVHGLSITTVMTAGAGGFLVWTLIEYLMHRFLFHLEGEGPVVQRIHFLMHGVHHNDPNDPTRLVMPPVMSLVLGFGLYGSFRFILGPMWIDPFFSFFIIGYLCYDYIHFAVHHFTPKTKFGKMLKHSHMQHHFVAPHSRFGVSSPIWDYVFGTMEEAKNKESMV